MKWIKAYLASALLVAIASALHEERICTEPEEIQVFRDLGLPDPGCGIPLGMVSNPASFSSGSEAGVEALRAACTGECIGVFAQGLFCECGFFNGGGTRSFCYESDGQVEFCREAFPDMLDPEFLDNTTACLDEQPQGECPTGCDTALEALAEEIGCCFQIIYNGTLTEFAVLSPEARELNDLLRTPTLWDACNVTIPIVCPEPQGIPLLNPVACAETTSAPPPGGNRTCTEPEEIQVFRNLGLPDPGCGIPVGMVSNPVTFTQDRVAGVANLRTICTAECIGAFAQGLFCDCNFLSGGATRSFCIESDGRIEFCREAFPDVLDTQFLSGLATCIAGLPGGCPNGCDIALQAFADEIGCCFQTIYNSTLTDVTPLSLEAREFNDVLRNQALWNACDVDIPIVCSEPQGIPLLDPEACAEATVVMTTEAMTTDAMTNDATTTEEAMTTANMTTDAMTTDAMTNDATTTEAMTTDATTTEEAMTTANMTTDAMTTDAMTNDATTTEAVTTDATTTEEATFMTTANMTTDAMIDGAAIVLATKTVAVLLTLLACYAV